MSCPSVTSCFAVGGGQPDSLAEHWDGNAWSVVPSPTPGNATVASLRRVSCRSAVSCYAVGTVATTTTTKPLVEHWDGTAWALVPGPAPAAAGAALSSVSCPSRTSCTAVGSSAADRSSFTLTVQGT